MSSLAILVPMYNPHKDCIESLCNSLEKFDSIFKDIEYSVVLVNDGSTHFEESNIKKLTSRSNKILYFSYEVNQGKGYAVRFGASKIKADFYVYTDIDFPFGFEVINSMYQMFTRSHTNLIVGVRDKKYFKMLPLKRRIISITVHTINNVLTGFRVHDTQAGIKGFDNEAKKELLATKTNEFLFDLEFIRNCLRHRLKYSIIKINARPEIRFCDFSTTVIKQELKNLFKIIFKY